MRGCGVRGQPALRLVGLLPECIPDVRAAFVLGSPYFRVFNPILQGEKFDPDGTYVRRWVPELTRLPNNLIHQPWTATPIELTSAGVELGKTYPQPIVDHKQGRERALAAYAKIRSKD